MQLFSSNFKLGILGGGQLGKMLMYDVKSYDLDTKIMDSNQAYLGDVDFAKAEISKDGAPIGRLERWSNGMMVIAEDNVVGKLEERFLEGMNATFHCFHHHFVIGRVSFNASE